MLIHQIDLVRLEGTVLHHFFPDQMDQNLIFSRSFQIVTRFFSVLLHATPVSTSSFRVMLPSPWSTWRTNSSPSEKDTSPLRRPGSECWLSRCLHGWGLLYRCTYEYIIIYMTHIYIYMYLYFVFVLCSPK